MKIDTLSEFETYLRETTALGSLYGLVIKDDALREFACRRLVEALLRGQSVAVALRRLDGDNSKAVFLALEERSLLTSRRVVVVEGAEKWWRGAKERVAHYLEKPNPDVALVLCGASAGEGAALWKSVAEKGVWLSLSSVKPWEREKIALQWLQQLAAAAGKRFGAGAAELLVKQVGGDFGLLQVESDKLFCYVGERVEIGREDVVAVGCVCPQEPVWRLGEAILRRDGGEAMRLGRQLMEQGEGLLSLSPQVRRQLETGYQLASLVASGASSEELSKVAPHLVGGLLEKQLTVARHYGPERFKRALLTLLRLETAAKNSGGDVEGLADLLFAHLSQ